MHFRLDLDLSDIDLSIIDLLDTHLNLLEQISPVKILFKICLQYVLKTSSAS